jgi:hypothetical protein
VAGYITEEIPSFCIRIILIKILIGFMLVNYDVLIDVLLKQYGIHWGTLVLHFKHRPYHRLDPPSSLFPERLPFPP